ncbi:hypothetical protein CYMTET_35062, partial [Cymbomonas tetramitiformis]
MLENGLLPELVYPPSSTAIGDGEATKIITALEVVLETAERFGNAGERQLSDVPSLVKGLLRTQNLAVQADLAKQKATEGDLEDAMRLYVNILEADPDNTEMLDAAAPILIQLGYADYALQLLTRSVKLSPTDNPEKYVTLASLETGESALDHLARALKLITTQEKRSQSDGSSAQEVQRLRERSSAVFTAMAQETGRSDAPGQRAAEVHPPSFLQALEYDEHNKVARKLLAQLKAPEIDTRALSAEGAFDAGIEGYDHTGVDLSPAGSLPLLFGSLDPASQAPPAAAASQSSAAEIAQADHAPPPPPPAGYGTTWTQLPAPSSAGSWANTAPPAPWA